MQVKHPANPKGMRVSRTACGTGDRIDFSPMGLLPDGLIIQAVVTTTDTINWRMTNATGSNIASGVNLVNYRFTR